MSEPKNIEISKVSAMAIRSIADRQESEDKIYSNIVLMDDAGNVSRLPIGTDPNRNKYYWVPMRSQMIDDFSKGRFSYGVPILIVTKGNHPGIDDININPAVGAVVNEHTGMILMYCPHEILKQARKAFNHDFHAPLTDTKQDSEDAQPSFSETIVSSSGKPAVKGKTSVKATREAAIPIPPVPPAPQA